MPGELGAQVKKADKNPITKNEDGSIVINLPNEDVPVEFLVRWIVDNGPEEYRGKVILYDKNLFARQTIKLIAGPKGQPLKVPNEKVLFHTLETYLAFEGFSLIPTKYAVRVVKANQAKEEALKWRGKEKLDDGLGDSDRLIAQVVPLNHVPVTEVLQVLNTFKDPKITNIQPIRQNNTLFIIDRESRLKMYMGIIDLLDREGDEVETSIIEVKYSSASYLKTKLIQPLLTQKQSTRRRIVSQQQIKPLVIADERTNSLIVSALPEDIEEVKELVKQIDMEVTTEGHANIQFYKLKNSKAKEIAATLSKLYSRTQIRGKQKHSIKTAELNIVPDENINALLIINASKEEYQDLKKIIEELDVKRNQVLIIGTIMEVSQSKLSELAVELAAIDQTKISESRTFAPFAGTATGISSVSIDPPGRVPGIPSGGMISGLTYGSPTALPFLLQAAATDGEIEQLAQPSVMANDNESATIEILSEVPYDTNTVNTEGNVTATTFGGYLQSGITLKITPHINSDHYLILEVEQNVSQFDFSQTSSSGRPGKNSRKAITTVTVPNRGTVVIGGLTKDTNDKSVSKVPFLGDIPILGHLFRRTNKRKEKRNLYIFISPIIMTSFEELQQYADIKEHTINKKSKIKLNLKDAVIVPKMPEDGAMLELPEKAEEIQEEPEESPMRRNQGDQRMERRRG